MRLLENGTRPQAGFGPNKNINGKYKATKIIRSRALKARARFFGADHQG